MKKNLIANVILFALLVCATTAISAEQQIIVSPQWVAEKLNNSEYVILHIVNLKQDYIREHLPGARMLWQYSIYESTPERNNEPLAIKVLDSVLREVGINKDTKIILYYCLGDIGSSARIYVVLDWLGLGDRTYIMNGGIEAWKAAGLPVTKEIPIVKKGNFAPELRPEVFAELDYVEANYKTAGVRLVDGRSVQAFNQATGAGIYRGGHIPGAINMPWTFVTDSTNRFRPLDSVDLKIKELGVKPTDEIIAYCWSGQTTCRHYVALKALGYKVRLYDGSLEEWSRIDNLPVEINPAKTEDKPKGN